MIDINLLPPQNLLSQKEKNLRSLLMKILGGATILLVLVSGIIFGAKFYFDYQLTQQTQKRDQLAADFKSEAPIASKVRTLKDKVSGIKIIQDSQTNFASIVGRLRDVTADTRLKNFIVDSDGRINLSASTDDIPRLDSFIQGITSEINNPFGQTLLSGLRRDPGGGFSYSVNTKYFFTKAK